MGNVLPSFKRKWEALDELTCRGRVEIREASSYRMMQEEIRFTQ